MAEEDPTYAWQSYADLLEKERHPPAPPVVAPPKQEQKPSFRKWNPLLPHTMQNALQVAKEVVEKSLCTLGRKMEFILINSQKNTVLFDLPKLHTRGIFEHKEVQQLFYDFMFYLFFNFEGCFFYRHPREGYFVRCLHPEMVEKALQDSSVTLFAIDLSGGYDIGHIRSPTSMC